MERNWYVICTKQQQEKNAVKLLTKKGIKNYCPFTNVEMKKGNRVFVQHRPLFNSFIFVHIEATEIQSVKSLPGIVNMVYWKSQPVLVKEEEIDAVKLMEDNYMNIKLEKSNISINDKINFIEKNISDYQHRSVSIRHHGLTVSLPSLGYTMIAEREKEIFEKDAVKENIKINGFFPKILSLFFSLGI